MCPLKLQIDTLKIWQCLFLGQPCEEMLMLSEWVMWGFTNHELYLKMNLGSQDCGRDINELCLCISTPNVHVVNIQDSSWLNSLEDTEGTDFLNIHSLYWHRTGSQACGMITVQYDPCKGAGVSFGRRCWGLVILRFLGCSVAGEW